MTQVSSSRPPHVIQGATTLPPGGDAPTALRPVGVPFAQHLDRFGDRMAVATSERVLTYRQLADAVDEAAIRLGVARRLVMITAANNIDSLVGYLAALQAGHPVLLVGDDNRATADTLISRYDPDVVLSSDEGGWVLDERHEESTHTLHPDLALLLSTSGSTGSSKLVRLSHENLQANAESIAEYLDIRDTDRAMTSLPMSYCYGLSVINSHLLAGAGLILTDNSVVDQCFWSAFRTFGATSFAGVPYTFELLDRVGFDSMELPTLRYVTQAGGRLAPEQVSRWAECGERNGWKLFVMYGQTEATARMAYLPPELTIRHPSAIGIPIPGGSFEIGTTGTTGTTGDDGDGDGDGDGLEGELIYRGPNVMLGYADEPGDLARGRTIDALHTGDVARQTADGLYEVVGRMSRFVKLFGLRIDLARVEQLLDENDITAMCSGTDDHLAIAVHRDEDHHRITQLIGQHLGLPASAVRVHPLDQLPRLANGKPDHAAVRALILAETEHDEQSGPEPAEASPRVGHSIDAIFATVFEGKDISRDATFASLGGDSLSYVEMSVRIEEALGFLPEHWHTTPVGQLADMEPRNSLFHRMETNVVLRAVAIFLIVSRHVAIFSLAGGAHILLAISGFNFARFQLSATQGSGRPGRMLGSIARIAIPSMIWIALVLALTDHAYTPANIFLLNDVLGSSEWSAAWYFWYIEALVQILLILMLVLAIPAVRDFERRRPFGFTLVLLGVALVARLDPLNMVDPLRQTNHPITVAWFFVLGWAVQRAVTRNQRLLVTALILLTIPGFFEDPSRDALVTGGLLLLLWVPSVPVPHRINRVIAITASASLYLYLTHWVVYKEGLAYFSPVVVVILAMVVGIAVWRLTEILTSRIELAWASRARKTRQIA